ncbi:unnamed protein product [Calicophoron daubneyi]|uniref:C2H2-type domain-containing protein n=1 Tax=Calicophoron daubneyi TaxID=300641 RepID=A0AAV2T0C2_CALDB
MGSVELVNEEAVDPGNPLNCCSLSTVSRTNRTAGDVLPHYTCTLDYSTLPIILLSCLPIRIQRLIERRVQKSPCPLFVVVTSAQGQWCLVQLAHKPLSDATQSPQLSELINPKDDTNSPNRDLLYDLLPVLRLDVDQYTVAHFSDAQVVFQITSDSPAMHWQCPFCGASFNLPDVDSGRMDILRQHLRLHIELRCCMDCSTLLPNNTVDVDFSLQAPHSCVDLISPTSKGQTPKPVRVVSSPFSARSIHTNVPPSPAFTTSEPPLSSLNTSKVIRITTPGSNVPTIKLIKLSTPESGNYGNADSNPPERRAIILPSCTICNIDFKCSAQYQQHMKNVHRGPRYVCTKCDSSFSTRGNLTTHFQQVHNRNTTLQCPICEKRLSNKFNVDRHIRSVHPSANLDGGSNPLADRSTSGLSAERGSNSEDASSPSSLHLTNLSNPDPMSQIATGTGNDLTRLDTPTNHSTGRKVSEDRPRGFYLYLSTPITDVGGEVSLPGNDVCQNDALTSANGKPTLVAEVQLTPCPPSNPGAQYGTAGTAWHQNVLLVDSWSKPISSPPTCPKQK